MNRTTSSLLSVILAYGICAASGVNKCIYMCMKAFYPSYVASMWVVLAVLFTLYAVRIQVSSRTWMVVGPLVGYVAGIVAYQLGPAIRDGSFVRSTNTIATEGLTSYAVTSVLYPLLCFSPVVGLIASAVFVAFTRSATRYIAVGVVGVVFVVGWSFFLSHGALPTRW
jgi:hypothetical protein